jgi:hypothetical protein
MEGHYPHYKKDVLFIEEMKSLYIFQSGEEGSHLEQFHQ